MPVYSNNINSFTEKSVRATTDAATRFGTTEDDRVKNMFAYTKEYKDVTGYRLMRGVPDFGSLVQFNPYETGYAAFIICQMPKFMEVLAKYNADYNKLVKNWAHIVEYEFKSFDGLEDMSADTIQLGDDLNSINVINKVNMQSASEFSLTYDEKSGSPLTKFARLYLTGIKDKRTQVKTYHGLIHNGILEDGFENEVFTFLFMATDNTMRKVEYATLLIGCQLNSADTSMYNYTKGDIGKKEVTVKFSGYPIIGTKIDQAAQDMLSFLISTEAGARRIVLNSDDYDYTGIDVVAKTLNNYIDDTASDAEKVKGNYASLNILNTQQSYNVENFYTSTNDIQTAGNEITV